MFEEFLLSCSNVINCEDIQKTFSCDYKDEYKGEPEDFYYMYAEISSGTYGSASEIRDTDTKKIVYEVSADKSTEKKFYLFIVLPKDSGQVKVQKGLFFFQNVGAHGVKTITTELMIKYFSTQYGVSLKCNTVAPSIFINTILKKENIKKLIMVRNHLSDDAADNNGIGYGTETRTISNIRPSDSLWETIKRGILWCSQGRHNLFEFERVNYDKLKLVVTIGDKERTINVHNIENLSVIEQIPDEIRMADGYPNKEKLLEHFVTVACGYLKEMALQIS